MAFFSQVAINSELIIIIVLNRNILRYILPEQGALGVGEACVEFPQRGVEPVVEEEQSLFRSIQISCVRWNDGFDPR